MITNSSEAAVEIERRRFPKIFLDLQDGRIPPPLVGTCEPVKRFYEIGPDLVGALPYASDLLPLWETNSEWLVALEVRSGAFIRLHYETLEAEQLGQTYQQFLSELFLELSDSGIWDQLDDVGSWFGYKHTAELRRFLESCDDCDFEAANRRFLSTITD